LKFSRRSKKPTCSNRVVDVDDVGLSGPGMGVWSGHCVAIFVIHRLIGAMKLEQTKERGTTGSTLKPENRVNLMNATKIF